MVWLKFGSYTYKFVGSNLAFCCEFVAYMRFEKVLPYNCTHRVNVGRDGTANNKQDDEDIM